MLQVQGARSLLETAMVSLATYMGFLGCDPNVAPSLGPILGAVLAQKAGGRWTFSFLAVSGAACLVMISIVQLHARLSVTAPASLPA